MLIDLLQAATRGAGHAALSTARRAPVVGGLLGHDRGLVLDGSVILVTGAARGLGAEVARQAHAAGAHVALVGRSLAPLQELADELGERAAAFEADVTDLEALQRATDDAVARFGGVDVVVANAGIAPPSDSVLTIDPAAFEHTVDVDLLGQWRTLRATLPALVERQGHVLVVASIYAFVNGALNASYAASKAGVEQLVRAVRVELAPQGVTAGVAYLGFIETDLADEVFARDQVAEARATMPAFVTRPIPVAEAAAAVLAGVERRAPRVGAPGWVLPVLAVRSLATGVMDTVMLHSPGLARAIENADRAALQQRQAPPA